MALKITNQKEKLPADAVLLTEEQAIKYQTKLIDGWKENGEVYEIKYFFISIFSYLILIFRWALRLGSGILGSVSVITSIYINNHFRYKLKLGSYGRFSTYMPIVVIPAIMTTLFNKTVSKPLQSY